MCKKSFNYACVGVCFKFPKKGKPQVLVVFYINDDNKEQKFIELRFPCGTVQFSDIYDAIMLFIAKKKITNTMDPIFWIPQEVNDFSKFFEGEVKKCTTRHEKNMLLESCLTAILNKLEKCNLTEKEIDWILQKSRQLTLEREIRQETDAQKIGKCHYSSSSIVGNHERVSYVSSRVSAPDLYKGSGDVDIENSTWLTVEEVSSKICRKHRNYLESAIKKAVEKNIHPRVSELLTYSTATNH